MSTWAYGRDMHGIVSYGAYLPYWRLPRAAITGVLGTGSGGRHASVSSFDEDTTSMGVEAGRLALAVSRATSRACCRSPRPPRRTPTRPTPPPSTPPCAWPTTCRRSTPSGRSGPGSGQPGWRRRPGGLAVLSDVRTGRPGSADEAGGGDAAVALAFGATDVVAEVAGAASVSAEFTDRWRTPGAHLLVPVGGALRRVHVPAARRARRQGGARRRRPVGRTARPRHRRRRPTRGRSRRPAGRSAPGPRRWPTTSPPRSATPVRRTGRSCWRTSSTGRDRTS